MKNWENYEIIMCSVFLENLEDKNSRYSGLRHKTVIINHQHLNGLLL